MPSTPLQRKIAYGWKLGPAMSKWVDQPLHLYIFRISDPARQEAGFSRVATETRAEQSRASSPPLPAVAEAARRL